MSDPDSAYPSAPPDSPRLLVGIGSSAGGLEALTALVRELDPGAQCGYVVLQHLSPSHRSMLVELLARETRLTVRELRHGDHPRAGEILVAPAAWNASLEPVAGAQARQHIVLRAAPEGAMPRPSINGFFTSLAQVRGNAAVGVVLSGTGSDGTEGLKAIKSAGGITFAQAPETAKYANMPQAAIRAGIVDHIRPPAEIAHCLAQLAAGHPLLTPAAQTPPQPDTPEDSLKAVLAAVRDKTGLDFSDYKPTTLGRRLEKRMGHLGAGNLEEYLAMTRREPEELDALSRELMISVTGFFRDLEAFVALTPLLRERLLRKSADADVRVWVPACATGEEAYTLAMLCDDLNRELGRESGRVLVFATDIDEKAINLARAGHYPAEALHGLPERFRKRYFSARDGRHEVTSHLRDMVVFSRHDLVNDPPFAHLDLVSCRNLLIYFNPELQAKVLSTLHFALDPEGILLLGKSESTTQQEDLFQPIDRKLRLYRRQPGGRPIAPAVVRTRLGSQPSLPPPPPTARERFVQVALERFLPPALLVDAQLNILHSQGRFDGLLVFPSAGRPEMNLGQLIAPELRAELMSTLLRARHRQQEAVSQACPVAALAPRRVRLSVLPAGGDGDDALFLVTLAPLPTDTVSVPPPVDTQPVLEEELVAARESIQNLMEEMAAANEEMQALNEEAQAANEELEASNEELEATNEELQAANEELVSLNEEMLVKSAELAATNADFENVYNTLEFPLLVFDRELRLRRANTAAARRYDLPQFAHGLAAERIRFPDCLSELPGRLRRAALDLERAIYSLADAEHTYRIFISPSLNAQEQLQSVVLVVVDNSDLARAERQLATERQRLQAIVEHAFSAVALKDPSGRYLFVNAEFGRILGVDTDKVVGQTDIRLFPGPLAGFLREVDLEAMRRLDSVVHTQRLELANGPLWLQVSATPVLDAEGVIEAVAILAADISQGRHAEEQLRLAAKVFDRAGEAIVITEPDGTIVTVNEAFSRITGYTQAEAVGQSTRMLRSGRHSPEFYQAMWSELGNNGYWQGEILNRRKNGEIYPEWLTINCVRDEAGQVLNYIAIFSDITSIKNSQRRIEYLATHDDLTGLCSRPLYMDRLKHALAQAVRGRQRLAVIFIDLDNFKNINDTLGHDVGDELLKEAAQRLHQCVRDSDTLARMGGDEFTVILHPVEPEEIELIGQRILEALSASFRIRDRSLFVSASIGISVYPEDGQDSATLIKHADTAMYRAKEMGKNRMQFFAEEMRLRNLRQLSLETGLRLALQHDAIQVHYQPQVDLASGAIVGAEALARWRDSQIGQVSPAEFIPAAERSGLIASLSEVILRQVLADIGRWRAAGLKPPRVALNISPRLIRDAGFLDSFESARVAADIPAAQLAVELTEGSLMDISAQTLDTLERLRAAGITLSVDDFGTGYSNLHYLRRLPLTELKIDRSFVDDITIRGEDYAIASAILAMARALGLEVVAEGVETAEQAELLASLGCRVAQGYHFHKPMPEAAFAALLQPH